MRPMLAFLGILAILVAMPVLGISRPMQATADGIGYFPSTLQIENALRGQRYQIRTVLVNQSDEQRIFLLETAGATAPWTTFARQDDPEKLVASVTVEPRQELAVLVYFSIPETAANGDYEGTNKYDAYTKKDYDEQTGVVLGFEQAVKLTVTGTQVLDLQVRDVFGRDVEVGQPLRVRAQVSNKGNVDLRPLMQLTITTTGTVQGAAAADKPTPVTHVADIQDTTEPVKSGESKTVEALWDTLGQAPGNYHARYSVLVQGKPVKTGDIDFKLLPFGALSRGGTIKSIQLVGAVEPGSIARADVVFQNTGLTDSRSKFVGQLYRDGKIVAEATSPIEMLARPGEQITLSTFFPIPANGKYQLRGRVAFEGAQTDESSKDFRVGPDQTVSGGALTALTIGGTALAIVAVGGAGIWRRRRTRVDRLPRQ